MYNVAAGLEMALFLSLFLEREGEAVMRVHPDDAEVTGYKQT